MTDPRLMVEIAMAVVVIVAVIAAVFYAIINGPTALNKLNVTIGSMSDRITTLEKERERDHQAMMRIQLRLAEVEIGVRILIAQVKRMGGEPEWTPATEPPATVSEAIDDVALFRSVAALFNVEELDDLAFRIGIDPESIEGRRKDARARSLVTAAKQRDLLPELIDAARQLRPEGRF